jgi:phospho-N-acetylmuramoyl-pentapeptide-transferase
MLSLLSQLQDAFGPFRLFKSHSVLILVALYLGFFLSWLAISRLSARLPNDRGRDFAVENATSKGKPTGAGIFFISVFTVTAILCSPLTWELAGIAVLTWVAMLFGYLDDSSAKPWSDYKKGLIDLLLALLAAVVFGFFGSTTIWLPFVKNLIPLPIWVFIPYATILMWTAINTTNCSDGVDGLSGTLVTLSLITVGILFYFVLGRIDVSRYLLLPFLKDGARWAVMVFALVGCLLAYLWFNAFPSRVLMGDAGSRALGFFLGAALVKTGNPFLFVILSTVLLVNGGTGLVKVAFLRFLNVRIFHGTRFPLHDHVRQSKNWSNTQVVMKFLIIQLLITLGLVGIILKIR